MRYGRTQVIKHVPVVTANGAYTAADAVGDVQGLVLGTVLGAGVLKSVCVIDADNQKAALTILYFGEQPSSPAADNAAFVLTAANAKKLIAKVNVAASDYETIASRAVAHVEVSKTVKARGDDRTVWVAILTTGTPTYTAVDNLVLQHGIILDGN